MEIDFSKESSVIEITEDNTHITQLLVLNNKENIKTRVEIIHNKPHLHSRINIRTVVFDDARFDFEAVLKISKGAIQTDTYLKIECLIVGERSYARAIPSLEIKESDVKAGHGATIGYLDPEEIYYIKSKGIDDKSAEQLLINAFLSLG